MIRAAAETQRQTGAAITFHVGRDDRSASEIIGVLREAGADMEHTILGHLELRIELLETLDRVAESGCFLEFDMFGHESSYFRTQIETCRAMRSDWICSDTSRNSVCSIASSCRTTSATSIRLSRYGGHGYAYIPECVAPRMRAERGFTEEEVRAILVSNPARAFAFATV